MCWQYWSGLSVGLEGALAAVLAEGGWEAKVRADSLGEITAVFITLAIAQSPAVEPVVFAEWTPWDESAQIDLQE